MIGSQTYSPCTLSGQGQTGWWEFFSCTQLAQMPETVHELVTSLTTNQATIWKAMSNNRYPISSSSNGGGMNGNGRQNVVNPDGGGGLPLGPNAPTQPRQRRPPRATAPSPPSQVGSIAFCTLSHEWSVMLYGFWYYQLGCASGWKPCDAF